MKISDFLAPADVKIDVASTDKKKLLAELAREAAAKIGIGADCIAAELLKREELGSTGVGGGVAIPHARFQQASVRAACSFASRSRSIMTPSMANPSISFLCYCFRKAQAASSSSARWRVSHAS
jgi:mannitol/fructose-specific phosphotransferase system IIA component (Ntr-type)